jgi:hypothetical protein
MRVRRIVISRPPSDVRDHSPATVPRLSTFRTLQSRRSRKLPTPARARPGSTRRRLSTKETAPYMNGTTAIGSSPHRHHRRQRSPRSPSASRVRRKRRCHRRVMPRLATVSRSPSRRLRTNDSGQWLSATFDEIVASASSPVAFPTAAASVEALLLNPPTFVGVASSISVTSSAAAVEKTAPMTVIAVVYIASRQQRQSSIIDIIAVEKPAKC